MAPPITIKRLADMKRRFTAKTNEIEKTLATVTRIPALLSSIVLIVIYLVIYDYVRKLEAVPVPVPPGTQHAPVPGCPCSADWRRTYIAWYVIIGILIIVVNAIFLMYEVSGPIKVVMASVHALYELATLLFVIFAIQYVNRLKREKCQCSETAGRTVLQIVSWFYVAVWALALISILFGGLFIRHLLK